MLIKLYLQVGLCLQSMMNPWRYESIKIHIKSPLSFSSLTPPVCALVNSENACTFFGKYNFFFILTRMFDLIMLLVLLKLYNLQK